MKTARFLMMALALLAPGVAFAAAEVVHDAKLDFSFTVPDGFHDFPSAKDEVHTLYAYSQGQSGGPDYMVVAIEDMHGTIGRDHLTLDDLPKDTSVAYQLRHEMWKGFDIDVVAGHGMQGDGDITVLVAQVPLTPSAIRIKVMGATDHVVQLNALLTSVLASVDGKSNWLTDSQRSRRLGYLIGIPPGVVAVVAIFMMRRRRRKAAAAS